MKTLKAEKRVWIPFVLAALCLAGTTWAGPVVTWVLLLAALGLARAGKLGVVGLAIVLAIWAVPKTYGLKNKSNASDLRQAATPQLRPGDLVISMQPEQAPLLRYHLGELGGEAGLRYATPIGLMENDQVMDWRDVQADLEDATPGRNLEPLLANLPRSGRVLLVHPVTASVDDWDAPWTQLVRRRSAQWGKAIAADGRFRRVAVVPPFYRRATRIGIRGVLYEKTGT